MFRALYHSLLIPEASAGAAHYPVGHCEQCWKSSGQFENIFIHISLHTKIRGYIILKPIFK